VQADGDVSGFYANDVRAEFVRDMPGGAKQHRLVEPDQAPAEAFG
jgi:hypothetical protein